MKKLLSPLWLLLIAALGTAALAWVYWDGWNIHPHANASELGQLGDFFGGLLNPLVSALTLFVAISVWRLQKDELELTRNEMTQTKLAMEEQAKTSEQQRQEQRFFDLFNIYQRTIDSIRLTLPANDQSTIQHQGKDALDAWFRRKLPSALNTFNRHGLGTEHGTQRGPQIIDKEQLELAWQTDSSTGSFDHYLRVIYRLLADSESLLGEQHFRYVKILRAQLNRNELTLLGFNMWLDNEGKKMIPFAERYGLLKHLPQGHLRTELENSFPKNVFGITWASQRLKNRLEHAD